MAPPTSLEKISLNHLEYSRGGGIDYPPPTATSRAITTTNTRVNRYVISHRLVAIRGGGRVVWSGGAKGMGSEIPVQKTILN